MLIDRKPKNILRGNIIEDLHVTYLSFNTDNKTSYSQLRKDFIAVGYNGWKKAYGIEEFRKKNSPIDIMKMISEGKLESYSVFLERKN